MFSKKVILIVSVLVLSFCVHNSEQRPKDTTETVVDGVNKVGEQEDEDIYDEVVYNDDDFITRMAELIDSISSFDDDYSDSVQPKDDDNEDDVVVEAAASTPSAQSTEQQSQQLAEQCSLPVRKGVCRALIPRWNYDPVTKTCKEFKFGGCDGNGNNFSTQKLCENTCKTL